MLEGNLCVGKHRVLYLAQENTTDLLSVGTVLWNSRRHSGGKYINPVKNMSLYHCMIFQLV